MTFMSSAQQDAEFRRMFRKVNDQLLDLGWILVGWMSNYQARAVEEFLDEYALNPGPNPLSRINSLMLQHVFSPNVRAFTIKRLMEQPTTRRVAHHIEAATFQYYHQDFLSCVLCVLPAIEGMLIDRMGWTPLSGDKPSFKAIKASLESAVPCSTALTDRLDCHRDALVAFMNRWIYGRHTTVDPSTSYLNRHYALHCMGDGCYYGAADCHRLFTFLDVYLDFLAYETGRGMRAFIPDGDPFIDARIDYYASLILGDISVKEASCAELAFMSTHSAFTKEADPPDWRRIVAEQDRAERELLDHCRKMSGKSPPL